MYTHTHTESKLAQHYFPFQYILLNPQVTAQSVPQIESAHYVFPLSLPQL